MAALASISASGLNPALIKLIEVVEEENTILREHRFFFHSSFTDRKNQALRELMAAQRSESPSSIQLARPLLRKLAAVLGDNARLLKLHITAVGEVSDIIIGSLRAAESDGTYSRNERQRVR